MSSSFMIFLFLSFLDDDGCCGSTVSWWRWLAGAVVDGVVGVLVDGVVSGMLW